MLQAAIAVEHVNAPSSEQTPWDRIAAYYSHLAALAPDPVVELNWAVAIAMAGDLDGGLARIDALAPALDGYLYFHAARADLLRRSGTIRAPRTNARWSSRQRRRAPLPAAPPREPVAAPPPAARSPRGRAAAPAVAASRRLLRAETSARLSRRSLRDGFGALSGLA